MKSCPNSARAMVRTPQIVATTVAARFAYIVNGEWMFVMNEDAHRFTTLSRLTLPKCLIRSN
jgi:putative flippase GtrA